MNYLETLFSVGQLIEANVFYSNFQELGEEQFLNRVGRSFMRGRSSKNVDRNAEKFEEVLEAMLDGFVNDLELIEEILLRIGDSLGKMPELHAERQAISNDYINF